MKQRMRRKEYIISSEERVGVLYSGIRKKVSIRLGCSYIFFGATYLILITFIARFLH